MNNIFRHSLLLSLGIVMTTISLLAFASMAASLFIADTIQGEATAINLTGALRMRSYQISDSLIYDVPGEQHWRETHKLLIEFKKQLTKHELLNIIPDNPDDKIFIAYKKIESQWAEKIEPLFEVFLDEQNTKKQPNLTIRKDTVANIRYQYGLVITAFVDNINYLVTLIEEDAETKIQQLRIYQYISLALTIFLVLIALILVYKRVHIPMKELLTGAERVSNKDFTYVTTYTGGDELGQLGLAYNSMTKDLSEIYDELEDRVKQKTIDLERGNCSMELLYKTVRRLNEAVSPHHTFPFILNDIERLIGTEKGAICLSDQSQEEGVILSSTFKTNEINELICDKTKCSTCLSNNKSGIIELPNSNNEKKEVITIPISHQNKNYGLLIIESSNTINIQEWQKQLFGSIADHIGIAINLSRKMTESRRLSLMEERGVIARELHDSLAQSLTFMKIQVSRLTALMKNSVIENEATDVIQELKIGLNSAYRELRELLTTFRLKIDDDDFRIALEKTITEFNGRGSTLITCENNIIYFDLTPNEEIHILQLIREALSNIVQHSKATKAVISLKYNDSAGMSISITDNGQGINDIESKQHHYGLIIMNERAQTLNGELNISKQVNGGTSVELTFIPCNKGFFESGYIQNNESN